MSCFVFIFVAVTVHACNAPQHDEQLTRIDSQVLITNQRACHPLFCGHIYKACKRPENGIQEE